MKTNLLISGILLGAATFISAATNDLTSTLQRGLFEEEANQNLGAAIQAYQAVASQFDKDRKLAATAIFRLGECYRKQGNTNDAATQYQRILRDFSDQPTLITLSRQYLSQSEAARSAVTEESEKASKLAQDAKKMKSEWLKLDGRIRALESLEPEEAVKFIDDEQLKQEVEKTVQALKKVTSLKATTNVQPEEVAQAQKAFDSLKDATEPRMKQYLETLRARQKVLELQSQTLVGQLELSNLFASPTAASSPAPISSEAEEVKRIQALIKDSPDLINAPVENGLTLLKSAAKSGKLAMVKALLESGAAVDGLQQPALTALHYAAANGHKAVIDLLLSRGAKAGSESESGVTPLHLAAGKGYVEVAKALLAAGAPVNARATKAPAIPNLFDLMVSPGKTPLHLAANAGYSGMVELLLTKGTDVNAEDGEGRTPLSYAVEKHYQPVAQRLLAAHANPNAGQLNLPLAVAANSGDMATLKLLLASGADPNTNAMVNWSFSTKGSDHPQGGKCAPLFLAVNQRHADAARELLRCKADPNGSTPIQRPLLYEALPDASTLGVLLDAGADPNRSVEGVPLLVRAVWDKNQPAVELLLAHHAEVNCTNSFGHTGANGEGQAPLHAAAAIGSKAIAELLLNAGAAVNAKDQSGATPLYRAVESQKPELAALLLAYKADPNAKANNAVYTPLHLAVSRGQRDLVELLLANKADPNERDSNGQTPLDMAKGLAQGRGPSRPGFPGATRLLNPDEQSKAAEMVDLLRQHGAVDDLPSLNLITVRRSPVGSPGVMLTKSTNDWNQFTLLDLIGMQYILLTPSPGYDGGVAASTSSIFNRCAFPYPDLAHVHISRPTANLKSWQDQVVDLSPLFTSADCSANRPLAWGDVVVIPESDHPLNEQWPGFTRKELDNLKACLTRKVELVVKGVAKAITLAPRFYGASDAPSGAALMSSSETTILPGTPFWLRPVLFQSRLVLVSSDLSRVKVTRRDPATGQERQWVVDCSEASPAPDFWLRDGDKIEVPEKGQASAAAEAPGPQTAPPK
jgi:ankyrin repeat protein